MEFQEKKGPEPDLYQTDSGPRQGQVTRIKNLRDLEEVPSVWTKVHLLSEKLGAETIGVEQLPEEARNPNQKPYSTFFVWSTANFHYSGFTTGALGPLLFGLGWWDSFLTVIFFNFLADLAPGVISYLGPRLGMRSMIIVRYSFGFYLSKVIVLLNAITCIGWIIINTVAGGGLLYDAADAKMPLVVAIIIILVLSLITSFLGYRAIHLYDKYGWLVLIVLSIIVVGFGGKHFVDVPMAKGDDARLGVLSYGALVFSWGITWVPLAADYSLYMPSKTPKWQTFFWTFSGIYIGSTLAFLVGIAIATLISNPDPFYNFPAVYDDRGIGGLVGAIFEGHGTGVRGFGRFIEVLLALSIMGANIPNIYSFGLSVQAISTWTQKIPRILVTLFGFAVAVTVSCILRNRFVEALENFLNVLSYWCTPFAAVVMTEHFWFRRRIGYNVEDWSRPAGLPTGIAAFVAWACGITAAFMGADQTWLVGPAAKSIGGADIGWELGAAVGTGVYLIARTIDLKITGR
ncbi:related to Purine-cytosine permease fcyB [Phialocephala subalpina]|uniref:Related to Purine-cytosine permease fcyB n=1 Tax=Phialocephala subalpina TaxID=576137 RepID=A0A1L7WEV8_9HELO|nr:related to Purine-cytosine permease fcyB [Phialocephala subalpina]